MRLGLVLAVAMVSAGCLGGDSDDGDGATLPVGFSTLLCGSGLVENGKSLDCLHRATPTGGPANEVSVAVDPTNPLNVVGGGKDYRLGASEQCGKTRVWSGHYHSSDGGVTWTDGLLPGYPGDDATNALKGYACITDPVLQYGSDGTAYYSGLAYGRTFDVDPEGLLQAKGSNLFVAVSRDGGRTFSDVHVVAEADGDTVFHDKQWFTVDPNDPHALFVTWSAFVIAPSTPLPVSPAPQYTNLIAFSRSLDGGVTWSPMKTIADLGNQQTDTQFSTPVVTGDGTVHVTFLDYATSTVQYTRSTDRGDTWTTPRPVIETVEIPSPLPNTAFRTSTYPVLAADASGGDHDGSLYVAWPDYRGGDADVLVAWSRDGGGTWSDPMPVNDDASGTDQFMPWVTVDADGRLHAAWYDRRDDAGNRLMAAYYATSADGGITWSPNLKLSPLFDGDLGIHQGGESFIGDYIGVSVGSDRAVVLFPGTWTGGSEVYAAVVPK